MAKKLLSISILFLALGASSAIKASGSLVPKDIFSEVMSDDFASHIFHKLQWSLINTRADSGFIDFFSSTPELSSLFQDVRTQLNNSLDQFSISAQVSMLRLGPGLTEQYTLIDDLVLDLARDLGFSQQAIKNREVYVTAGGMNAFTVSGNRDRIIVVLQSELISKMSLSEIKAVLGHEMGHIRSMHSSLRFMHTIMLDLVARQFGVTDLVSFDSKRSLSLLNVCSNHMHAIEETAPQISSREALSYSALMDQGQRVLAQVPHDRQAELAKAYLQYLLVNLQEAGGSQYIQNYFYQLMQSLGAGVVIRIDVEQLDQLAENALAAISRSNEKSADMYSASVVNNVYIGSAFLKLAGIDFKPQERPLFLNQILNSAQAFYNTVPEGAREPFMGTTHPSINLRIADMLNEDAYPSILFANPFLRLLLLEEALRIEAKSLNGFSELPFERLEQEDNIRNLQNRIVQSIAALGLSAKVNPRFENTIQYLSLGREALLRKLVALEALEVGPASGNPGFTQEAKNEAIALFQHNLDNKSPIAIGLLKALEDEYAKADKQSSEAQILKDRIDVVSLLLQSSSAEELKSIRKNVTHPLQLNRPGRIPVEIDSDRCVLLLTAPSL